MLQFCWDPKLYDLAFELVYGLIIPADAILIFVSIQPRKAVERTTIVNHQELNAATGPSKTLVCDKGRIAAMVEYLARDKLQLWREHKCQRTDIIGPLAAADQ